MPLEYPGDSACDTLDRQYMLGERLLVAPVFTPDGTVDYYPPSGRWTNFLSGETVEGGRRLREQHGYLSLPLMVRPNTVLPVGALDGSVATTVEARRDGTWIEISMQGAIKPWSVLLRGVDSVDSVEGGSAQAEALDTRVLPHEGISTVIVYLQVTT